MGLWMIWARYRDGSFRPRGTIHAAPFSDGPRMRAATASGSTPWRSRTPSILGISGNAARSSGETLSSWPVMIRWVRCMWSTASSRLSTCSRVCEKGPCPTSWRRPAARTSFRSAGVSSRAFAISPATWPTPRQCSNREWFAPGKTRYVNPSWRIELRRCNSSVSSRSRVSGSRRIVPWIVSVTVFRSAISTGPRPGRNKKIRSNRFANPESIRRTIPATSADGLGERVVVEAGQHRVVVIAPHPGPLHMEAPGLVDPEVRYVIHDRARREVLVQAVAFRLVQLRGRGVDQGVEGRVAVPQTAREEASGPQEREHVVVGVRVVRAPAQEEDREATGPQGPQVGGPVEGPDAHGDRPGAQLIVQGLQALTEEETSLAAFRVPRVVVQGDVEAGGPVGSLPELRRGARQVEREERRAHIVARDALRDRAAKLDPRLVRHVVHEPLVVERIAEGLPDVSVREERRRDLQRVGDRGGIDRLVVPEDGDVEGGSGARDPEPGVARRAVRIHHVELMVAVDDRGVRVSGEQEELSGGDIVRLLDADPVEGRGGSPVSVEAGQDDRLVRHPSGEQVRAGAAIAAAVQHRIAGPPIVPGRGTGLLDDGADGEGDRLEERRIRSAEVNPDLVRPDLLHRGIAHGPRDGSIQRPRGPVRPLGGVLQDGPDVRRDRRPGWECGVRIVRERTGPVRRGSAGAQVFRDVVREGLFQYPRGSIRVVHGEDPTERVDDVVRREAVAAVELDVRPNREGVVLPIRGDAPVRGGRHLHRETRDEDGDVLDARFIPNERLVHIPEDR